MNDVNLAALRQLLVERYDDLRRRLARRLGSAEFATEVLHETYLRLGRGAAELGIVKGIKRTRKADYFGHLPYSLVQLPWSMQSPAFPVMPPLSGVGARPIIVHCFGARSSGRYRVTEKATQKIAIGFGGN